MTIEIVLLAMVAAFLGLRLYSVLGKRTGHEQEPTPRHVERPVEERRTAHEEKPQIADAPAPRAASGPEMVYEAAADPAIRAILAADRNFDVGRFVDGAKAAYAMVLEAYWKGDRDELRVLCDDDVYDSFVTEIEARQERGETIENRLVRIDEARIIDAVYDKPLARITMQFDADIASVIRDSDGNLIAGSLTDAVETHDRWTFSRDLTVGDPNWILDETDEL
ncbi:MAG: Tim44/TimA family putative adaptor protein [Parasphingorhabdus sp.]|nr:Tim44/TimA family putative adaptor protein [Parasphingorhabdus sp.]